MQGNNRQPGVHAMIRTNVPCKVFSCLLLAALGACGTTSMPAPPSASSAAPSGAIAIPDIPAAVPVTLDARTTALLILDINSAVCQPNPDCVKTVPAIASLLGKARTLKVPVIYSSTVNPAGPPPMLTAVAPQAGEPVVVARADKFTDTNLDDLLKQRNASTLIIVGSAANGAVMYSAFHANTRGYTVVVAEDGISSPAPVNTRLARYQLLNQPGFINSSNTALADKKVTLSRSDLITFK
jgi:nicotinamidase-related amidase